MLRLPLEIVPRMGAPPIRLGMKRREVEAELGRPARWQPESDATGYTESHYYGAYGGIALNFDANGRLHVIQMNWDEVARPTVLYAGLSVFDTPAEELVARLAEGSEVAVRDGGHSALLTDLGLILWRPVLLSDYRSDAPEDEYRNGKYWTTIEVWRPNI